jgi:hypothetical protein
MTQSTRLLGFRAKNGDEAAAVKLAAVLAARGESGPPNSLGARQLATVLPSAVDAPLTTVAPSQTTAAAALAPKPHLRLVSQTPAPKAVAPVRTAAQEMDRSRIKAVLRSPHAAGRIDLAMALLDAEGNFSAEQILAHLPNALTDVELAAKAKRDAIDASWARAYGVAPQVAAGQVNLIETTKTRTSADDVWARQYGSVAR